MVDPFPETENRRPRARSIRRQARILAPVAAAWIGTVGAAAAQIRIEARAPVEISGAIAPDRPDEVQDPGPPVQMLESPNIDRFLRKAQDFLTRENYPSAVKLLQDVIEGRTLVETDPTAAEGGEQPATGTTDDILSGLIEDSRHAVFSQDGRLFRPVRLLCHELLASMPPAGVAFYRSEFEVTAERALEAALDAGEVQPLQAVFERWFLTIAAARAMEAAGDRLLDRGRPREAIRTYRLLLDVWPDADREAAGIDPRYVELKAALALQLTGDDAGAGRALDQLSTEHPDASLRIAGELTALDELAKTGFSGTRRQLVGAAAGDDGPRLLRAVDERLVPLWEHRFIDPDPYRRARAENNNRGAVVISRGESMGPTPQYQEYRSGGKVAFDGPYTLFLDHFRLTVAETATGRLVAVNDGTARTPDPVTGQPRVRIPAYDFGTLRPVVSDERVFTVVGPDAMRLGNMETVLRNDLEAWSRDGTTRLWHAREHDAFADTTWLAAPTVFGPRLLAPTWRKDTAELTCVDIATGEPIYSVPLHRGGTEFVRPPGTPVVVDNGIAYVVTHAGAVAAVDAVTGGVRWIRRYERAHPLRARASSASRRGSPQVDMFRGSIFREQPLEGFAPADTIVASGLVIVAPTDGDVLLCLDGATGEPVWMVSRRGTLQYPIGHDGRHLFVAGRDEVFCIGLESGVRYWSTPIPAHRSSSDWRGRAALWNGMLLVPGEGAILARGLGREDTWQELALPEFRPGHESLEGAFDLQPNGAWLVASHAGGVAVYSSATALAALADGTEDPERAAVRLAQADRIEAAIDVLADASVEPESERAVRIGRRLLELCTERALDLAREDERDAAIAVLDRARERIAGNELLQRWHLARVEMFRSLGDLDAVYQEQDRLYQVMARSGT